MYTKIYKGEAARSAILGGAEKLFDAVAATYGPESGNVGILREWRGLDTSHDGVTVANSIKLEGPERAGAEVISRAASKMDKELGDGTSTVVILSFSIIKAVQERLMVGESPIRVRDEIKREAEIALKPLDSLTKSEVTQDMLRQVAAISASSEELGKMVADIVWEVGSEGSVSVELSTKTEDSGQVTNGYTIDNGVVSNYMVKDPETMSTTLITPNIVVANKKFDGLDDLTPIIQSKVEGPILIIANDFSEKVISTIVSTNNSGRTDIHFVKSPRFGEKRLEFLKDIASVVGTKVVEKQGDFANGLGGAAKVIIEQDKTTIIEGVGNTSERVTELKGRLKLLDDSFEQQEMTKRIASINGKAATIYVGGHSQDEANEKVYRADDAVFACQAALKSGVVAGGGTTPLKLAEQLPDGSALKEALQTPFKILLENVGLSPNDYTLSDGFGVNVRNGQLVDLFKEGVIEPADTIRKAVESAVSIAGNAITMTRLIVEEKEKEDE